MKVAGTFAIVKFLNRSDSIDHLIVLSCRLITGNISESKTGKRSITVMDKRNNSFAGVI